MSGGLVGWQDGMAWGYWDGRMLGGGVTWCGGVGMAGWWSSGMVAWQCSGRVACRWSGEVAGWEVEGGGRVRGWQG